MFIWGYNALWILAGGNKYFWRIFCLDTHFIILYSKLSPCYHLISALEKHPRRWFSIILGKICSQPTHLAGTTFSYKEMCTEGFSLFSKNPDLIVEHYVSRTTQSAFFVTFLCFTCRKVCLWRIFIPSKPLPAYRTFLLLTITPRTLHISLLSPKGKRLAYLLV